MTSVVNFNSELQAIKDQGLYRSLRAIRGPQGPVVQIGNQELLNFCSNDYLGMANDERLVAAMHRAVEQYGVGSGASPLVCGRSEAHQALERQLAEDTGRDRALIFSSGYAANLALVAALSPGRNSCVIEDRLNHASLLDGAILGRSKLVRYKHRDLDSLARQLARTTAKKLVLTDAVFSMDGDLAPLTEIAGLCSKFQALLAVDDAHGFGVLGEHGMGSVRNHGLTQDDVPVLVLTFGKAVGVAGACIAGRADVIEMLIQKARPYIYSTAMPPALAVTVRASLDILKAADGSRDHLQDLINTFRQGAQERALPLQDSDTPIQPLIVGSSEEAMRISAELLRNGILVAAIRPPTVPRNSSRLRITLTAAHTKTQVQRLLEALVNIMTPGT